MVRAWTGAQAYRWQTYATAARLMGGGELGSASSMMKVFWSELDVELHATALRLLGDRGELVAVAPDAVHGGSWMAGYLFALSGPIYAGTNEIQRRLHHRLAESWRRTASRITAAVSDESAGRASAGFSRCSAAGC